jgi:hypothetical protein
MELAQHIAFDLPRHLHVINLFDSMPRMREAVRQFAVVRDEDQALRCQIKTTDAKYSRCVRRQQIDYSGAAGWVASGRDNADGFVDGKVCQLRPRQHFAIHANFLPHWINAGAEFRHNFMIDFHATCEYQFFAFAPAGDSGLSEYLLETPAAWMYFVLVTRSSRSTRRRAVLARRILTRCAVPMMLTA